jgi:Spy/CpxP family protein refolding chaperone
MIPMKKTITIGGAALSALLSCSIAAHAQEPGPRGPRDGQDRPGGPGGPPPIEMLAKRLGLSEDQKAQLKALHEKSQETNRAVFDSARQAHRALDAALEGASPDPATVGQLAITMRAAEKKADAARQAEREEMKSILTPEQREKLDQGPRGFGPPPGGPREPR